MIEVTQKISDYVWVDDDYKKGESKQTLRFRDMDDFQNWQGYTLDALGDKELTISIKIKKEDA